MRALTAWISRYRDACTEIDRLTRQIDRFGSAFGSMLPLLSDDQLAALDRQLDIHEILDGSPVTSETPAACSCEQSELPVP